ncbi:hypothetical protein [Halolamina salifodinae]|uniref:Uncharacterized protein n=1 Tax=Halolamina salifodinae TaxID=1202767 RepID=A0A8T4GUP6_9EURY|nr:hypothetical protein [Halolamina salifodinae]MBP1986757.1 hypothetical protein [Halolamina salifodinae]
MIGWVLGFFVGVLILVLKAVGAVFYRFLLAHEYLHMVMASRLGVAYRDRGHQGSHYIVEMRNPTPGQLALISFAPICLAVVAVASFLVFWSIVEVHFWFSLLFLFVGVGCARFSPPSFVDVSGVFLNVSRAQPLSSVLSSVVALPLLILRLPCLLFPRHNLYLDWLFVALLFYGSFVLENWVRASLVFPPGVY